jgi:hypothetical protein
MITEIVSGATSKANIIAKMDWRLNGPIERSHGGRTANITVKMGRRANMPMDRSFGI